MNCLDGNSFFFYFPQLSKSLGLGSAFLAVNMAHFNQLQLRSMDNQGNCSSQHSDPVHYSGSHCAVPGVLRPPEYCSWLRPAQPGCVPPHPVRAPCCGPQKPDTEVGWGCLRKSASASTGTDCKIAQSTQWVLVRRILQSLISFFTEIHHQPFPILGMQSKYIFSLSIRKLISKTAFR